MPIPKVLHRIWVGPPMPAHLAAYGESWVEHHPGWEHVLWTEENLPPLRNQRVYDAAERIAPRNVGQLRADVARYEILLAHGGVYVDADMECLRPIDDLIEGSSCFAGWEVQGTWVNNAILGAEPGHAFIGDLVEHLEHNVVAHQGKRPNVMTGPQYLTPIYRRHADEVTVFPVDTFYSYLWSDLGTEREGYVAPGAHAVHHWGNRRSKIGQPGWDYAP